jgi:acyl carrier protein
MSEQTTRARLLELPRAERQDALARLVRAEFARALLYAEDEQPPPDVNYFDLGLTSLRAAELKQRLESALDCELDAAALFGCATIRQLTAHLAGLVLPGAEDGVPAPEPGARGDAGEHRPLVDELIQRLYTT